VTGNHGLQQAEGFGVFHVDHEDTRRKGVSLVEVDGCFLDKTGLANTSLAVQVDYVCMAFFVLTMIMK
jgi:hypothetical protein